MSELWKPIPGYEGYYEVSDWGRVRSLTRQVAQTKGPIVRRGKMMSCSGNCRGYPAAYLHKAGRGRSVTVHRLVLNAFVGRRPPGMQCRHLDGDKTNNRLSNLRWGTQEENSRHKYVHGTVPAGERGGRAKLDAIEVSGIRAALSRGYLSLAGIGRVYGVSGRAVADIRDGRTWAAAAALRPAKGVGE